MRHYRFLFLFCFVLALPSFLHYVALSREVLYFSSQRLCRAWLQLRTNLRYVALYVHRHRSVSEAVGSQLNTTPRMKSAPRPRRGRSPHQPVNGECVGHVSASYAAKSERASTIAAHGSPLTS